MRNFMWTLKTLKSAKIDAGYYNFIIPALVARINTG